MELTTTVSALDKSKLQSPTTLNLASVSHASISEQQHQPRKKSMKLSAIAKSFSNIFSSSSKHGEESKSPEKTPTSEQAGSKYSPTKDVNGGGGGLGYINEDESLAGGGQQPHQYQQYQENGSSGSSFRRDSELTTTNTSMSTRRASKAESSSSSAALASRSAVDSLSVNTTASTTMSVRSGDVEYENVQNMLRNLLHQSKSNKMRLPILSDNDLNDYKCEGYVLRAQSVIDNQLNDEDLEYDEIVDEDIEDIAREVSYYSKYFQKKEHNDFVGRLDTNEQNLFVLSVKYDADEQKYMLILRTKDGNLFRELHLSSSKQSSIEEDEKMFNIGNIMQVFEKVPKDIKPVTYPMASEEISAYDKTLLKQTFTFGIIYQKYEQISEKEIFSNSGNSKEFEEFLEFIGQRVTLKNFKKFRGGLDVQDDATGVESIYENYEGTEIMFHVSTFLPHSEKDQQYVERKRHIGNDRVAIVFQDRDTIFSPKIIRSKLLHVFMIVQPVIIDNETTRYKVSVISKKDVPEHRPEIHVPYIFNKDEKLKRFLLSKLISAEYASLRAPAFSVYSEKTLESSLQRLIDTLTLNSFLFTSSLSSVSSISLTPVESVSSQQQQFSESNNSLLASSSNAATASTSKMTVRDRLRKLSTHYLNSNPYMSSDPANTPRRSVDNHQSHHHLSNDDDDFVHRSKESKESNSKQKEKIIVEKQRKTSSKKDYNSDTSVNSELQQQHPSYNAASAQKQAQFHYYQNLKHQQSNEQSVKLDSVNDLTDPTADQKRHSARLTNRRETISGAEMTTPTNSDRNGEQTPPHMPHKSEGDMPGTDIKIVIEREQSNDPASNFAHTFNQELDVLKNEVNQTDGSNNAKTAEIDYNTTEDDSNDYDTGKESDDLERSSVFLKNNY